MNNSYTRVDPHGRKRACTRHPVENGFDIIESSDGEITEIKQRDVGPLSTSCDDCQIVTFRSECNGRVSFSFTVVTCSKSPCSITTIDSDGNEIVEGCGIALDSLISTNNQSAEDFFADCMTRLREGFYANLLYDGACGFHTRDEMTPEDRA